MRFLARSTRWRNWARLMTIEVSRQAQLVAVVSGCLPVHLAVYAGQNIASCGTFMVLCLNSELALRVYHILFCDNCLLYKHVGCCLRGYSREVTAQRDQSNRCVYAAQNFAFPVPRAAPDLLRTLTLEPATVYCARHNTFERECLRRITKPNRPDSKI